MGVFLVSCGPESEKGQQNLLDSKRRFVIYAWNQLCVYPQPSRGEAWTWAGTAHRRNTSKLAQLGPECWDMECSVSRSQASAVLRCEGTGAPRFFSQKRRNSECKTSCQIIRTANPGHSSTRGMILGIWNSVRGARWNQIKTKLPSVRLQARNPRLSMNFDRYKGNKRRENGEGVVLYFRWAPLLWAAREQNGKYTFLGKGSRTKL